MKSKILLFFIWFNLCFTQQNQPIQYSPNGIFDTVYDRFGNPYNLNDILITNNSSQNKYIDPTCDSGIFRLHFENGSGFENPTDATHILRRNIACQVFKDLSDFIISPLHDSGNMQKVEIWFRQFSSNGAPIGIASGFYVVPESDVFSVYTTSNSMSSFITGGIVDCEIWKTIQSGFDSYTNVDVLSNPLLISDSTFYHGYIGINFNFNFNLDLNNIMPQEYDLYTVLLHEAIHTLGISSLINSNGFSNLWSGIGDDQYYSRYDVFLQNSSNISLLTSTNSMSSLYEHSFSVSTNDIHPNNPSEPCNSEVVVCNDIVHFSGTNITNLTVFTPECFELGNSLSHFEDSCILNQSNDDYFLMSNRINLGTVKRFLQEEERQALCDIGYNLQSNFGSSLSNNLHSYFNVCNGTSVAGINDGITTNNAFVFIGEGTISSPINISGILDNDKNATHFEGLQDVYDSTANIIPSSGDSSSIITFSGTIPGVHLLRYVPYNSVTNERGNITYIYVYIHPQNNCAISNCDNLVLNGGFEDYSQIPYTNGQLYLTCNWDSASSASPDYYNRLANTVVGIPNNFIGYEDDLTGDAYAGIYIHDSELTPTSYREIIRTRLESPLSPNTTYQLSFDVSLADNYCDGSDSYFFQAYLSNFDYIQASFNGLNLSPDDINGIHLQNNTSSTIVNGWETITFTFTTDSFAGQQYLYFGRYQDEITSIVSDGNGSPFKIYYYIDNVNLININNLNIAFSIPNEFCLNLNTSSLTLNLENYLNPLPAQIGTFSGNGVTGNTFTTNTTGTHTINYTYTNNNGCDPS